MMPIQFLNLDYNDFKTLAARFKPERKDVYYKNKPYDGVGASSADFSAWAIDHERSLIFVITLTQAFPLGSSPADIMPATFLTDFPGAVQLSVNARIQSF